MYKWISLCHLVTTPFQLWQMPNGLVPLPYNCAIWHWPHYLGAWSYYLGAWNYYLGAQSYYLGAHYDDDYYYFYFYCYFGVHGAATYTWCIHLILTKGDYLPSIIIILGSMVQQRIHGVYIWRSPKETIYVCIWRSPEETICVYIWHSPKETIFSSNLILETN